MYRQIVNLEFGGVCLIGIKGRYKYKDYTVEIMYEIR